MPSDRALPQAEQARIVQLLVERIDIDADGLNLRIRAEGLTSPVNELGGAESGPRKAA